MGIPALVFGHSTFPVTSITDAIIAIVKGILAATKNNVFDFKKCPMNTKNTQPKIM